MLGPCFRMASEAGSDAGVADLSDTRSTDSDVSATSNASRYSAAAVAAARSKASSKKKRSATALKPDSDMWSSMAVVDWDDGESEATECSVECIETDVGESLIRAAQNGDVALVETILRGCDADVLNYRDPDGYTPMHRATYNGHVDVMKKLLLAGADVRAVTDDGWEPLHCACRWNQTEAAALLLQNGASVNAKTRGGQTPLHLASSMRDGGATICLLLSKGDVVEAQAKNAAGETPVDLARRSGVHACLFEMVDRAVLDALKY